MPLKNEAGITLVELLATIVIVSLVVTFILGIQVMVQKQFKDKLRDTEQLTDVTIAMKAITKELRLAEEVTIHADNHLKIRQPGDEMIEYSLQDDILKRNNEDYIYEMEGFFIEEIDSGKVYILLESKSGKKIDTKIVIRGD